MKQKNYIAGLYFRLSQEDERQGESTSIENQRILLRKYAEEHGFSIHDEYIDDGVSGTTFDRPQVQRLLDDAKTGVINTILVKDLSRFGRNYIEVGQYVDYVFPTFGIRFLAIQDGIDTENRDSGAMEMMPIMNVFNEWHAANTSKKIRAVIKAKANEGIFRARKAPYGYLKGTDAKKTLVIDEETAPIVVRIFEMYASGISLRKITETLNAENIPSPGRYAFEKFGIRVKSEKYALWEYTTLHMILNNMTYLGHLMQLRTTSVSYKNHKRYNKDQSEWAIVYNAHPPIISQELWDRAKEHQKSVSHGRKTKIGDTPLLSGFVFCADCGAKMKMCGNWNQDGTEYTPPKPIKKTTAIKPVVTKPVKPPKPKQQQASLWDMLEAENKTAVTEQTDDHKIVEQADDSPTVEEIADKLQQALDEKNGVKPEPKKELPVFYGQYVNMKTLHPNDIVLERLGDFYEAFNEDATVLSDELDLTLTGRDVGLENRVPLVGFPYHVSDAYIAKI